MADGDEDPDVSKAIKAAEILVSKARVMGVTVVAKPAFQECSIELVEDEDIEQEEPLVADGIYMDRLTAIGRRGADRVRDGRIPHPRELRRRSGSTTRCFAARRR